MKHKTMRALVEKWLPKILDRKWEDITRIEVERFVNLIEEIQRVSKKT